VPPTQSLACRCAEALDLERRGNRSRECGGTGRSRSHVAVAYGGDEEEKRDTVVVVVVNTGLKFNSGDRCKAGFA
jgi:hypothetical protein